MARKVKQAFCPRCIVLQVMIGARLFSCFSVNLGDDADTVGAIYGQLAGAYYGASAIPEDWREKCFFSSLIECLAEELLLLSSAVESSTASTNQSAQSPPSTDKCELSGGFGHCSLVFTIVWLC